MIKFGEPHIEERYVTLNLCFNNSKLLLKKAMISKIFAKNALRYTKYIFATLTSSKSMPTSIEIALEHEIKSASKTKRTFYKFTHAMHKLVEDLDSGEVRTIVRAI